MKYENEYLKTKNEITNLTDYELFKTILQSTVSKVPFDFFLNLDSFALINSDNYQELSKRYNLSKSFIKKIITMMELVKRIHQTVSLSQTKFTSYDQLYRHIAPMLIYKPEEEFWVVYLALNGTILDFMKIASGNMLTTVIDPSIVFRRAISLSASAIILIHNHPSGNVHPSYEDYNTTDAIVKAGKYLNIRVLEHLVVGKKGYYKILKDQFVKASSF